MTFATGDQLGPYEILAPLGAGGMGEVYRARDRRLSREVAVKVLPTGQQREPQRVRRFEQEARSVAALNHPNILAIYDVGFYSDAGAGHPGDGEGTPYLVTELLVGRTLRARLRSGPLPPSTA